jgi:hypothetical protein
VLRNARATLAENWSSLANFGFTPIRPAQRAMALASPSSTRLSRCSAQSGLIDFHPGAYWPSPYCRRAVH